MARFPEGQVEIFALISGIVEGMKRTPKDFAGFPVSAAELERLLKAAIRADRLALEADALRKTRHLEKDRRLEEAVEAAKQVIRMAEITYRRSPEKLGGIGWGQPR